MRTDKLDRSRLSPRTPRGSGRIRRAVKGLPLDGVPRPLQCERRAGTVVDWDRECSAASFDSSRRMKTTCPQAGREDGAPHRLDMKTKDPLSGSDGGLWFSNDSTTNPPTLPGGFVVPRRLPHSASPRVGRLPRRHAAPGPRVVGVSEGRARPARVAPLRALTTRRPGVAAGEWRTTFRRRR